MQRASMLLMTAERYRMMSGTMTDPDLARRLIDYADELSAKAERLAREMRGPPAEAMDDA